MLDLGGAWVAPDLVSTVAFSLIVVAVAGALFVGARAIAPRWGRRALVALALWMGATSAYVAVGASGASVAGMVGFFAISNVTAVVLALSPIGARFATLPAVALIAPQALRLPLELVLHHWSSGGTIPIQMTFAGDNFDIVTGVFALVVALYGARRPLPDAIVWVFNVVGFALLMLVAFVALTSAPLPIKRYDGPPLVLVMHLPYALIAPMCVAPALFGHLVLFRKLLGEHQSRPAPA